jgi:hypothetical protein
VRPDEVEAALVHVASTGAVQRLGS